MGNKNQTVERITQEMSLSEKQFRNKVCFAAFLFSLMVVMIHSYNADMFLISPDSGAAARAVWQTEHFLADVLGPAAVPGFFMLSAYQFYRGCSFGDVKGKMERRIRTVLLPYLLWNFFYYIGYAAAGQIPFLAGISGKTGAQLSLPAMADAVLNFTYNPVFWYMYQLIFLIAVSPLLYIVLKNRAAGLLAIGAELYCVRELIQIPIINMDALFYYSAAAYCALHGRWLAEEGWQIWIERRAGTKAPLWGAAVRLAAAAAGCLLAVLFYREMTLGHSVFATVLYRFTVPAALWLAVPGKSLPAAGEWMKYGFFLYAIHFILARGMNKLGAAFLPHTAGTAAVLYLAIPVACVLLAWKLGAFLKTHAGPVWSVISGGR